MSLIFIRFNVFMLILLSFWRALCLGTRIFLRICNLQFEIITHVKNIIQIPKICFFSEPCSEIKCGVDAEKIENKAKPSECTCICPDEAKGDPFHKCDGKQTNLTWALFRCPYKSSKIVIVMKRRIHQKYARVDTLQSSCLFWILFNLMTSLNFHLLWISHMVF